MAAVEYNLEPVQELGKGFIASQSVLWEAILVSCGVIWAVTGSRSAGVQRDAKIRVSRGGTAA